MITAQEERRIVRALAYIGYAALLSHAVFAQSSAVTPKLGTVDIHPSAPNTIPRMRSGFSRGRYELGNATVADLIRTAWDVDTDGVVGGPEWLDTDRFDLIATAPVGSTPETLKTVLRALLADRFQLAVHAGTRNRAAYAIVSAKKIQLKAPANPEETGCKLQPRLNPPTRRGLPEPLVFACRNMTMAAFAKQLPSLPGASGYLLNYRVVDQTGLSSTWDFSIRWSMPNSGAPRQGAGNTITLFDAFENQLGLKLKLTKLATPVVVVDSVEKPAANLPVLTEKLPARPTQFEVASIKPGGPDTRGGNVAIDRGGLVRITMTLKDLIWEAWGNINTNRIVGGPSFMDTIPWVIVAKAPTQEDSVGWNGPVWNGLDLNSMRMMLRALLMDRFGLAAHMEDRLVSGYALVAAKPKLRKADPSNRPGCKDGPGADGKDPRIANPAAPKLVTCRNMTLAQFAAELSKPTSEENPILFNFPPVVDATGINGRYDITVNFTPSAAIPSVATTGGDALASEPDGTISIFEALDKQLGLKLESRKVTAPVLVIDHVEEMPTEN
jgi:uncharacterized protein (TIGR03435 family)